jgi:hypothetical protein
MSVPVNRIMSNQGQQFKNGTALIPLSKNQLIMRRQSNNQIGMKGGYNSSGAVGGQQVQVKPILSGGVRRTGGGPQAAYGQMQDMYYQARVQP